MIGMVHRYRTLLHFYISKYGQMLELRHPLTVYYLIWIRGCYAPQIATMLWYIRIWNPEEKFLNSFKVIQSERYYGEETFHQTMISLLCYIHYDVDKAGYREWMKQCVDGDRFGGGGLVEFQSNSRTKGFVPTEEETKAISESFDVCNLWLRELLDFKYPDILLDLFDWSLWE